MTVDDRRRLNLHRELDAVLGPEEADTLMAHLPSVTWNDVATKNDVRHEVAVLRSEMQVGFAGIRTEISQAMERQIRWLVTFNTALVVAALAAARLLF